MSRKKNITIEDIARHANVSISTVSRVLRNSSGVKSQKREAVLHAVEVLEYQPNIFAQSLASGQSMTIGVITQNFGSPFYDGILLGILQGLEKSDYSPIFADGRWDLRVEQHVLQTLINRRVDGLIFVGGQLSGTFLQDLANTTPLIVVAREIPIIEDNCIYVDNFKAGYEVTRFLLDQGHRNIAHITAKMHYQEDVSDIYQRFEGYKQAIVDAGLEPDPQLVVEGDLMQRSGVLAVEMLLSQKRPFSAIFCANDQMAFGARLALYRRGLRVPDEVSLVGFDDETTAAYMVPPLTTVSQPAVDMGRAAASSILNLINDNPISTQVFESKLILRESVLRHR
ncbi:MAG: LacI family transcriptional regulator [Chloroflexi bacterium]|nr:MAG: LacI family transcriptional regulator [Chloroflexota bacterium]